MPDIEIKKILHVKIYHEEYSDYNDEYYPDWDIEGYGETIIDAINNAYESDPELTVVLSPHSIDTFSADFIELNGHKFVDIEQKQVNEDYSKLARKLLSVSPVIKKHEADRKAAEELAKKEAKKQQEKEEREILDKLLKKYGTK